VAGAFSASRVVAARFLTALRLTRGAIARCSTIIVHENRPLELIGNFRNQLRGGFLQICRFLQ